ncbi:MAG: pre-peptidase C-terminal domain-containing protein [Anaerolineae bacterium]|nr:pre-peptidase C-terminal domain-containing protein [Anaerolineae bacterium]MDW8299012.1 pre-peptidase C-terminal domain-containing protein [Anaerolineae bacterium]
MRKQLSISRVRLFLTLGLAALFVFASVGLAVAQDSASRRLTVGVPVTGTLNEQTFAQTYTFEVTANTPVTITAISNTPELRLALTLTDANGQPLAQIANLSGAEVRLSNVTLPSGVYYVTVLRSSGAQGAVSGQFTLTLSAGIAASPTPVPTLAPITLNSMSVALSWATIDDLDLEVRDPVGNSVFFDNPAAGGATLLANVNNGCRNTVNNPTETIRWASGRVPAGSYEILVYYNRACRQPSAPVDFTVTVTVNGRAQTPIQGRLNAGEQYVASFILESAEAVSVQQGGANPLLLNLTPFAAQISAPQPLGGRTTVRSRIDRNNQVDVWSFEGTAGQVVSIAMNAVDGGSLDPQLILLAPDRSVLASNDDSNQTRNALIANQLLPVNGTYLIVATRFGKNIGGTEGNYELILSGTGALAVVPSPVAPEGSAPTATPQQPVSEVGLAGLPVGALNISLTWNNRADVRLLIRDPENRSLFSDVRTTPSGGILARQDNLNCANPTSAPITYAVWQADRLLTGTYEVQVWLRNLCGETLLPTFALNVNVRGQQVLSVQEQPDLNGRFYVTTFTINPDGTVSAGRGAVFFREALRDIGDVRDRAEVAEPLIYGRPSFGNVDNANPFTVYTFQARAGDRVRISMRATRGTLDPVLYLLDPSGVQLAFNDDAAANDINAQIDAVIAASGRYTIIATRFGALTGGTTGSFEIAVAPTR